MLWSIILFHYKVGVDKLADFLSHRFHRFPFGIAVGTVVETIWHRFAVVVLNVVLARNVETNRWHNDVVFA